MANYGHIIFFSLIGGVFSLVGAIILLSNKKLASKMAKYAMPFAAGALLAAVFLDLLKEGIEQASVDSVLFWAMVGVVAFFFAERFLHWFHHHHRHESQGDPGRSLIIIGDTMHNALDGVAIAAAFLVSVPTGIITTIAIAAHEIPQEIGDFGLLLAKGMSRTRVLLVNIFSALATTLAAVITFALGSANHLPLGLLLGLSAGFLLYIAASDIIPTLHENNVKRKLLDIESALLLAGVVVVGLSIHFAHQYIHAEPAHVNETSQVESHDVGHSHAH
ncbi:MAG: putative Zinc/iron permease [Candidatus Saccharibacteria bacterium]|nr:putative Zinc/iron permease [Candidatus Saccharibacteria bacterium]